MGHPINSSNEASRTQAMCQWCKVQECAPGNLVFLELSGCKFGHHAPLMRTAYILKPEVRPTASYSQGSEERTEIHFGTQIWNPFKTQRLKTSCFALSKFYRRRKHQRGCWKQNALSRRPLRFEAQQRNRASLISRNGKDRVPREFLPCDHGACFDRNMLRFVCPWWFRGPKPTTSMRLDVKSWWRTPLVWVWLRSSADMEKGGLYAQDNTNARH